ncbi:MAG: hypothetical protein HY537_18770 [Deltaproteobacteria bacterium]|nr:hypothetical protein [Deltaproteobacteria bacterium]
MGYYIKALPMKKSAPQWKLQFVSYKTEYVSAWATQVFRERGKATKIAALFTTTFRLQK